MRALMATREPAAKAVVEPPGASLATLDEMRLRFGGAVREAQEDLPSQVSSVKRFVLPRRARPGLDDAVRTGTIMTHAPYHHMATP